MVAGRALVASKALATLTNVMQRHRVNERGVGAVAILGAVLAMLSDAAPTGSATIDALIVGGAVAVTIWVGGSAPWWTISIMAGAAAVLSTSLLTVLISVVTLAASWWVGSRREDLAVQRSVIVAVACSLLLRSDVGGFLGLSALIGIGSSIPLLVLGLRRRRTTASKSVMVGAAVVVLAAIVASVGTGLAAQSARGDLESGQARATAGIAAVQRGDYLEASASFATAADEFEAASQSLSTPWATGGSAVPILAQNRRAIADLSARAASASNALAEALAVVDPEQLRLEGGQIDLDVLAILREPFETIRGELVALDESIGSIDSPWLFAPVSSRLDELRDDVEESKPGLDSAVEAVTLAPQLLGSEGERRYFIAVTTPAEARGIAGFMGNWFERSAVDGQLSVVRSGRTLDLNRAGDSNRRVTGPEEWLNQYGRFGFDSGRDGTASADLWSNITLSPDFSSTAEVIAEVYPQSGGGELDGVFSVDPEVIAALLSYTGPVSVAGSDVPLDASNAADFLLVGQYETADDGERVDMLESVSRAAIDRIFGGALPNPAILARDLGPLAREGRLLGWSAFEAEQDLFRSAGLAGELPTLDGGDGVGVVFTNVAANKLDPYLGRLTSYRSTVDPESGITQSRLVVEISNDSPTSGFPEGVIGNYTDDPVGTNRTRMSIYSALPIVSAVVNGDAVSTRSGSEEGWIVNSLTLAIAPGDSVEVAIEFEGWLASAAEFDQGGAHRLVTFTQPLVLDEARSITVNDVGGRELVVAAGTSTGVSRFVATDQVGEGSVSISE